MIELQVGCFLSFLKLFRIAAASASRTFLIVEDDIKFFDYARSLAKAAFTKEALEPLEFFSDEPCLIGLGRGVDPSESFAFNRSFALLALSRFASISHTADVFIHFEVSDKARHYSLDPPLAYELSTSVGRLPSRIHPKTAAADNPANSEEARAAAKAALIINRHIKHVRYVPLVVLGTPRGGTGFMAHALQQYGLDVGHETMGEDGISSWIFAVFETGLPFGEAGHAGTRASSTATRPSPSCGPRRRRSSPRRSRTPRTFNPTAFGNVG